MMVEETAKDYANYLRQIDFSKEIGPICSNIDEILTRMDEFETALVLIKNIAAATSLPNILECKSGFQQYAAKIDKLQTMLDHVESDLTAMEENMNKAESDLGYNGAGIRGFFKPFLEKVVKNDRSRSEAGEPSQPTFEPTKVFKASDYYGESSGADACNQEPSQSQ